MSNALKEDIAPEMAMTFASLSIRVIFVSLIVLTWAQRTPSTLLHAIEIPIPRCV